jgi:phosphatidylglycerophosphatase A
MQNYNDLIQNVANPEGESEQKRTKSETVVDYLALAVTTFGVGYLPLAPGTWGSMVGVGLYLVFASIEAKIHFPNFYEAQTTAWIHAFNGILFLGFCLLGIWAAGRSTKLFRHKDPSQAVVDEVIGQLLTFLFIPFTFSWKYILAGFLLFRLFDIWKPYPIDSLQNLPAGIGVCADDILAGVYAGGCLSIIYAMGLSL